MLLGVVLEAAELWSGLVLGVVLLEAVELWSVELGVCAGGFTGALALSPADPAGFDVVAAGALALFASVVGVWLLPEVTGGLLLAALLWSGDVLDAAAPVAAPAAAPVAAPSVAPPMLA